MGHTLIVRLLVDSAASLQEVNETMTLRTAFLGLEGRSPQLCAEDQVVAKVNPDISLGPAQ